MAVPAGGLGEILLCVDDVFRNPYSFNQKNLSGTTLQATFNKMQQ